MIFMMIFMYDDIYTRCMLIMRYIQIIFITCQLLDKIVKKKSKNKIKDLREYLRERVREAATLPINSCA